MRNSCASNGCGRCTAGSQQPMRSLLLMLKLQTMVLSVAEAATQAGPEVAGEGEGKAEAEGGAKPPRSLEVKRA